MKKPVIPDKLEDFTSLVHYLKTKEVTEFDVLQLKKIFTEICEDLTRNKDWD
jgi:hypothetical protein